VAELVTSPRDLCALVKAVPCARSHGRSLASFEKQSIAALHQLARMQVLRRRAPNPSIERTYYSWLRQLPFAAHVER
jgi:hypothetical protein